ncbi:MAG TPA: hypothetical protein VFI05_06885 [Nitrospiraceae bacterium]|nr:hypothetical protein [Nitrospiraceae bacterium]
MNEEPTQGQDKTSSETAGLACAVGFIIAIFLADLFIPAGVLVPMLYIIPIVIALRFLQSRHFVLIASFSALFTVLGLVLSPSNGTPWMVYANRSLALITIIAMCVVYAFHQRTASRLHTLQDLLPQCASCKRVRDDVGYWTQLELYLEEHRIKQFTHSLCPYCEDQYEHELLSLKVARNKEGAPL